MTVRTGTIQDAVYYGVFTDDANKQNDRLDGAHCLVATSLDEWHSWERE